MFDALTTWLTGKTPEQRRAERQVEYAAQVAHQERLEKAGGVSSVMLVCHLDTWQFIFRHVGVENLSGFNYGWSLGDPDNAGLRGVVGPVTEIADGMVEVQLSGPNLVNVLSRMRTETTFNPGTGTRAIAARLYRSIAQVVDGVDPDQVRSTPIPPIVVDDQISGAGDQPD